MTAEKSEGDLDLISMIKRVMLDEKLNDKAQIEDLKRELSFKNSVIEKLLANLSATESLCMKLRQ